ncbi:TetR/AcrR family transcriptional regulator [Paracoccus caeni]|uniref:TetR/AcrR family transcriptional regulator n=1 Tax=Paracoccus caeni TaxID=657651 RepID=A0A934SDI1_9RHOB|nr:TetR/AcrR family transcriptional regulator [Paracoccus caeni]MBK4215365.1 TetR/AcrR family transcriptional regulator [Paracoccus caeni]
MNPSINTGRGDVREALILAGIELLDEQATEGLSLRRIAARAGVSHAAPAHYFDGLPGLRHAIAQRGFVLFAAALATARDDQRLRHSFEKLEAICLSYIQFAANRMSLFRLMFDELRTPSPDLSKVATRSYLILQEASAPYSKGTAPDEFETTLWAMTHGYASLELGRERPPSAPFKAPAFSEMLNNLIARNG